MRQRVTHRGMVGCWMNGVVKEHHQLHEMADDGKTDEMFALFILFI